jgi:hypothetical protein
VLLLRPRAAAPAGWSAVALLRLLLLRLLRWLLFIHSRFTYVKH